MRDIFGGNQNNGLNEKVLVTLAEMFGYEKIRSTEEIAHDLNGRTWEEFCNSNETSANCSQISSISTTWEAGRI